MIPQLVTIVLATQIGATTIDVRPDKSDPIVRLEAERSTNPDRPERPPAPRGNQQADNPAPAPPPPPTFRNCRTELGIQRCFGLANEPTAPASPGTPAPGEADIERAVRDVGLPALTLTLQPGTRTLVNIPTIFTTTPTPFTATTTLLGTTVTLQATPVRYTWNHGDGTTQTSTTPGRPYPNPTITHRYTRTALSVTPSVDVTYRVTYQLNGGPTQTLSTPIVAPGPPVTLTVDQAAPTLTRPR